MPESTLGSQSYDSLKAKIVEFHEASKPEILDRSLRDRPLTGKPSHYLAEMEQLTTKAGLGEEIDRHRFQQALPSTVAPIIATQKATPLADLGKLTDELFSLCSNGLTINRVPHDDPLPHHSDSRVQPSRPILYPMARLSATVPRLETLLCKPTAKDLPFPHLFHGPSQELPQLVPLAKQNLPSGQIS